jgi:membrane protease YdiL (CAAX protease family)
VPNRKLRISSITGAAILFEGSLLALAFGLGWLLDSPPFRYLCLDWQVLAWGVLATIPPLLVFLWCMHSQWRPIVRLVDEVEDSILPLFENCSLIDFALISVLAGVAEEALFRGVIQLSLSSLLSPLGSIAFTGILFGLLHLITPTYAVLAGLIGVYLGWLIMVSDNLLMPIVVHVLYDFLALTFAVHRYKAKIGE